MTIGTRRSDFLSLYGLGDVWHHLKSSGYSTHAVIATDLDDGAMRSLMIRAKKTGADTTRIRLKYLHHAGISANNVVNLLELNLRDQEDHLHLESAFIQDQRLDITPQTTQDLARAFHSFSKHIIANNEWINPVKVLEESNLPLPDRGNLPGLYAIGDFKSVASAPKDESNKPVYPAIFLPAILGIGPDNYAGKQQNEETLVLHGQNSSSLLKYFYKQGATKSHMTVEGRIAVHDLNGVQEETIYKVETAPDNKNPKQGILKSLSFMGKDIDLSNNQARARITKAIRNINRVARAKDQALIDDLNKNPHERRYALPTELMLHTGIYPYLNPKVKIPPEGIMSFIPVGGNNVKKYVSDNDTGIGGNQAVIAYEYLQDGEEKIEAHMFDTGVSFHDIFDVAFKNPNRFFPHRHDKNHAPETPISAIWYTHRHKDHLGQLAYLVKAGYQLPVLFLSEMGKRQLKRDMSELDIEKSVREEIFAQCFSINLIKDINPQSPNQRKITQMNGITIEQWTEALPGKDLGRYEYYPRFKIGKIEFRVGPMPHSDPGLMFDIITPAGTHRHTGDYKFDDTIKVGLPPLDIWLQGHRPDTLSADSTGATKHDPNPLEADVGADIKALLQEHPQKRFIFPMLGSNLARLTTTIAAMGETPGNRKTLILDGKAVMDLGRDADKVLNLKKWANDHYGIDIIFTSAKKTVADFLKDPERDGEYALLTTGTQMEDYSSFNRAVRDFLSEDRYSLGDNDAIVFLNGIIPTGDNAKRRQEAKEFVEVFHRALVFLPESVAKEGLHIRHSSGHNDRAGIKKMIELSGLPYVLPVHGGPDQLQAHLDIAKEAGTDGMVLSDYTVRIQKDSPATPYKINLSELIGITVHTPSKERFYLKGRHSEVVLPIKPDLNSPEAKLIDRFENNARIVSGMYSRYSVANTLPIFLSRTFNADKHNSYLEQSIPFGLEKYGGDVFERKNIHAIGALDTETGGLYAQDHLIREFAMTIQTTHRETLDSIQLFQKIPDYRMGSLHALLVTNTNPYDLKQGLPAHSFSEKMYDAVKSVKNMSHAIAQKNAPNRKIRKNEVKALLIAHNTPFDSRFMEKEFSRNLNMDARPHQTRGLILLDTRAISRAMAAYAGKKYKTFKNPETGWPDHTLEALSKANKVKYDKSKAHGGQYDTTLCMDLFWTQYDIAPEIVQQMIINADSSTHHLLNDMMGVDTGFGGPHPIFSYVSPTARRPKPQMGSIITTLDNERYAVVFNLKYDPNDYLHLHVQDIHAMLKNWDNDVFEIFDMRRQPIIMPAIFGLKVKANGFISKETLDRRAGIIKRHINHVDPHQNWKTLAQKINALWSDDKEKLYSRIQKEHDHDAPQLDQPATRILRQAPIPEDGVRILRQMQAQIGTNQIYKHIHRDLREYRKLLKTVSAQSPRTDHELSHAYQLLINRCVRLKKGAEHVIDAINNVHFDIQPQDLSPAHQKRIQAMRALMGFIHFNSLKKDLSSLLEDDKALQKYVGKSRDKKKLLKDIQRWMLEHEDMDILSDDAKALLHPWRDITRQDGVNKNVPPPPDQHVA